MSPANKQTVIVDTFVELTAKSTKNVIFPKVTLYLSNAVTVLSLG